MMLRLSSIFLATLLVGCSAGSTATDTRPSELAATKQPEWFRSAVVESSRTMEPRCSEFAPLEIVFTDDPVWWACHRESMTAAASARHEVYADALKRCVADIHRTGAGSCCFSKVTSRATTEAELQRECDRECSEQAGKPPNTTAVGRRCESTNVSPPPPTRSRAQTAAAETVLSRCRIARADSADCTKLPSWAEREYCKPACASARASFEFAVKQCVERPGDSGSSCLGESDQRAECERRCQEERSPKGEVGPER
jgi:hypothetical protein